MQDIATVHKSRAMTEWFKLLDKHVMPWPSKSPDLNPIENVWCVLSRMIYGNRKQLGTVKGLEEAILDAWDKITPSMLRNHIKSMPKRCLAVVKSDGNKIFY